MDLQHCYGVLCLFLNGVRRHSGRHSRHKNDTSANVGRPGGRWTRTPPKVSFVRFPGRTSQGIRGNFDSFCRSPVSARRGCFRLAPGPIPDVSTPHRDVVRNPGVTVRVWVVVRSYPLVGREADAYHVYVEVVLNTRGRRNCSSGPALLRRAASRPQRRTPPFRPSSRRQKKEMTFPEISVKVLLPYKTPPFSKQIRRSLLLLLTERSLVSPGPHQVPRYSSAAASSLFTCSPSPTLRRLVPHTLRLRVEVPPRSGIAAGGGGGGGGEHININWKRAKKKHKPRKNPRRGQKKSINPERIQSLSPFDR